MNSTLRRELEHRLAQLSPSEKRKLHQRAVRLRRAESPSAARPRSFDADSDNFERFRHKGGSLHDRMLELLAEEAPVDDGGVPTDGLVVGVPRPDVALVRRRSEDGDDVVVQASIPPSVRRATGVVVGDEVAVDGEVIAHVAPRRTTLSRRDPGNPHQDLPIVANVDAVVVVASVRDPPFRPGLVDRYLVAIARGGAEAVLVVGKADLAPADDPVWDDVASFRRLGIPVLTVSAATGEGVEAVREALAGKTVAFVGHSGVGKSSLVRALDPSLDVAIGDVAAHGRGRHTTTTSSVHELPDVTGRGRTRVIDTPGVRSFGLGPIDAGELLAAFPDLEGPARRCRYRDCLHLDEPDCAVRDAVDVGLVDGERYERWRRLLADS